MLIIIPSLCKRGSAPWIRGTLNKEGSRRFIKRFSPVDTGNTSLRGPIVIINSVQPRGYGEHMFVRPVAQLETGSAPWIRGTRFYST